MFAGRELEYLEQCVRTGWVSSAGPLVDKFEDMVSRYVGSKYGVATVNGTAALHLAMATVGVNAGDEVIVPAMSFIAPANAVRYMGASPIFIDVEPDYWQIDINLVADFLHDQCYANDEGTFNRETKRRVKAIIPVHILGHPVEMDSLLTLAREHNLIVVEDAAESLGAEYKNIRVGNFGDVACFSFNGNKIVTAGGGGMLLTDNEHYAERARHLSTQAKVDPIEYVHDELGYNYRLTNIQSALGCAQMEQLEGFISTKRDIADRYTGAFLETVGLTPMKESSRAFCTYWLYTILIGRGAGIDSRKIMASLADQGIQSRPLWQPLPYSPFENTIHYRGFPVAERLYREALSLPSSTAMTTADIDRVVDGIRACLQ